MLLEVLGLYSAYKLHKIDNKLDGIDGNHVYMLESQQYDKSIGKWTDWKPEPRYMFRDDEEAQDFAEELQENLDNTYRFRVVPMYVE